jgi:hypothetical protein
MGMFLEWFTGFLICLKKVILFVLLVAVLLVLFQYLTCPVYRFPEPKPFSGAKYFNPYSEADSSFWRRANFQVQSHAWGGLTDGRKNTNEIIDSVYRLLSYDIIATSDYQRINRWGSEKESFIPVYEHGYGLFKNHQVLLGSRKVSWADFPIYQNLNNKQHILNILRENNELVYIAHPGLRYAYAPGDMKYLTGYDGIEVLNYVIVSEAHWDSALSAGKYVTIMGNDDSHDVSRPLEVGHRCTYIYSSSLKGDSIVSALKKGRAYGADIFRTPDENMDEKASKAKKIPRLEAVTISGDTLRVAVNREAQLFRFIGQGGKVMKISEGGMDAQYVIKAQDSYIRTEIVFPDLDMFYLNPVIRYDGTFPSNPPLAVIDKTRSWIFWIISWATVVFLSINMFILRKKWRRGNWTLKGYLAKNPFRKYLLVLVLASFFIRAFLAAVLELGNDEVYYWTYALFPDLSHFDHPPMVGWVIQFFTLDLFFQDEFFLRLPGLVLGSISTVLVYMIGKKLKDELTGWYAAMLFTASIYCFVLSGTFILPDTPQLFFWLLSISLFIPALTGPQDDQANRNKMLLAGLAVGLAMLSKYTSVFLWLGALVFIILKNRKWLRSVYLYVAMILSAAAFLPVLIWNFRNDFISFTFQGSRVGFFQGGLRLDHFFAEIAGEVFYNNPLVFLIIILALVSLVKRRPVLGDRPKEFLLLSWSLPLIVLFLFISLFRQTLPHWTGPAYTTLIFLAAGFLSGRQQGKGKSQLLPRLPISALVLLAIILTLGVLQINRGILYTGKEEEITRRGEDDISMDMYGWDQVMTTFRWLANDDQLHGMIQKGAPIVSHRWFPAANIDYYVARPTGRKVLAIGPLESIHKYYWINAERGGLKEGMDAYYITTSRDYKSPVELFGNSFREIDSGYYFPIMRGGKVACYGFIFKLKGYGMTSKMTSFTEKDVIPEIKRCHPWDQKKITDQSSFQDPPTRQTARM